MSKAVRSGLAISAILVTVLNFTGRGLGFIREVLFAGKFGLSEDFDIYLVGASIPIIITQSLVYFAQNYFIPNYHAIPEASQFVRKAFVVKNFWYFLVIGVVLSSLFILFREEIINFYIYDKTLEVKNQAQVVLWIFASALPVNFLIALLNSYLIAELKYTLPSMAQLMLNVVIIFFVLLFSGDMGIYAIAYGFLGGYILQLIILLVLVRKHFSFTPFVRIPKSVKLNPVTGSIFVILFIEFANQLYLLVDRYFINFVAEGGISSLNYATFLIITPITILSNAVSVVMFPNLTKSFNEQNFDKLKSQFYGALKILLFLFLPLAMVYIFWGETVIKLIYERGIFKGEDVTSTAGVLKVYGISLAFYAAYSVVNKLIFSANLIRYLLAISMVLLAVKCGLNILLVDEFQHLGLAASTSTAYFLTALAGFTLVNYKLKLNLLKPLTMNLLHLLLLGLCSFALVYITFSFIPEYHWTLKLLQISMFGTTYFVLGHYSGAEQATYLFNFIKGKTGRKND